MLRMPHFEVREPRSVEEAVALLASLGEKAVPIAGGTDLLPNLKHRLLEPKVLVSLARLDALRGVTQETGGALVLGAMTTIDAVSASELVRARAPALALAAAQVSGPQLRRMGTLGGNVMLDTRCRYFNQTYFWRKSLGFCLKKDGTVCHVVAGGKRCVAAASNDTAPALMTLGASLTLAGPQGTRVVPIDEFFHTDGAANTRRGEGELLVSVRVPAQRPGHRGAYVKLRSRESIDFPLLGVAARVDLEGGAVADADVAVVALQARPVRLKGVAESLKGKRPGDAGLLDALEQVGQRAYKQCNPMPNVTGDHEYRHEMVPVFVRRALLAALGSE